MHPGLPARCAQKGQLYADGVAQPGGPGVTCHTALGEKGCELPYEQANQGARRWQTQGIGVAPVSRDRIAPATCPTMGAVVPWPGHKSEDPAWYSRASFILVQMGRGQGLLLLRVCSVRLTVGHTGRMPLPCVDRRPQRVWDIVASTVAI